jgi:hypothetical protein
MPVLGSDFVGPEHTVAAPTPLRFLFGTALRSGGAVLGRDVALAFGGR